jgi:acetylornithine deacetylase/succinyl-diaminopimelate desuccinylase-like protein
MMDCYTAAGKSLPVNVVFVLEGEEEHGSLGFRRSLEQNLRWLEDTSLVGGMRGA